MSESNAQDDNIQMWKVKRLIRSLEQARGNGTSMITLILPPKEQISKISKMLTDEAGTASNIKSRVNRLSVQGATVSVQARLKLYTKMPTNGLVIFCGTVLSDDGKERKVNYDFEPFRPLNTSLYMCDNKFHTEALSDLLTDDAKFGFLIMDGNGSLFGTLCGNAREVLHKFTVDLPKKHGRGGQSALRFARLREEKRHNYIRKVAEVAAQLFITNDKVNVEGLVLAGSADLKKELSKSDVFDPRLSVKVLKIVDISYGGESGFNQAIALAEDCLSNVKFLQERKLLVQYFNEINMDSGKVCYGLEDTLKALDMGACETLLMWENLEIERVELKSYSEIGVLGHNRVIYVKKDDEESKSLFIDPVTNQESETVSRMSLLEYYANNYKEFGTTLEIVTDKSQEGAQFVLGFGGIGGLLRYKVEFADQFFEDDGQTNLSDEDFM